MDPFPDTSVSLIARIKNPSNHLAWQEFEQIYRPVIFRIARSKGFQYADAFDLVQQVLMAVVAAIPRYDDARDDARFRHWLAKVTRNAILKAITRKPKDAGTGDTDMLDVLSGISIDDAETDAILSLEVRRELFRLAANDVRREVQDTTWLAFEMTVINSISIEEASKVLGISTGNIYAARSRIMRKIRDQVGKQAEFLGQGDI